LDPPPTGTYVDIRRGTLIIIGRVVWIGGERFGIFTQGQHWTVAELLMRKF
jgi:hypothetical protein